MNESKNIPEGPQTSCAFLSSREGSRPPESSGITHLVNLVKRAGDSNRRLPRKVSRQAFFLVYPVENLYRLDTGGSGCLLFLELA